MFTMDRFVAAVASVASGPLPYTGDYYPLAEVALAALPGASLEDAERFAIDAHNALKGAIIRRSGWRIAFDHLGYIHAVRLH